MYKILIVDDEEAPRNMYTEFIKFAFEDSYGKIFEVITAEDGVDGLKKFKDNEDIVMVATDVSMPNMDGYEMVKRIRELGRSVRVLICTGTNIPKERNNLGVDNFLQKPYVIDELINDIENNIEGIVRR